ncbi:TolC family protein [Rhizobium oryzicola]|uniref:TolC family protein n=1 Tax=Rhizobium oryzicola TaxID=1232668 RepID=A0ABT8T2A3_9HYPH|nr:TolC family protein [Rhizobium oryzicola]MDO1584889.1 TolC family protein [Rhizobium oryzicola]
MTAADLCSAWLRSARILGLLLLPLLAGCQIQDLRPQAKAPALPAAYQGKNAAIQASGIAQVSWWQALRDPMLERLMAQSLAQNLTLVQAQQRLTAARALAHSSIAAYSPNVGLNALAQGGTAKATRDDPTRRPLQVNLDGGWEVSLFGQKGLTRIAADASAGMAAQDVEAAKLAVMADVASAYTRLRARQQRRMINEALIGLLGKNQVLEQTKAKTGLQAPVQADLYRMEMEAAKLERSQLEASIADTLQQIATLLGTASTDPGLAAPATQPVVGKTAIAARPADLLRQRPDVRRAELVVLQSGAEVGLAEADLYPKIQLSGMIGIGTAVAGSVFSAMGGSSIQLPLFDQGKRRDIVTARKAQLEEAMAAYRQNVLSAYEEASAALRAWQLAKQNTARLTADLKAADAKRNAANLLLRQGLADASGSLGAQIAVLRLRGELVDSVESESLAFVLFSKAIGGSPAGGLAVASGRQDAGR